MANDEDLMQQALFTQIFRYEKEYPFLARIYHTPNGGKRNLREAVKLKSMGVRKGVVDVLFHGGNGFYRGFALELKVGRNKPTPEQKEWLDYFNDIGYLTEVVRDDWTLAWDIIKNYFNLRSLENAK